MAKTKASGKAKPAKKAPKKQAPRPQKPAPKAAPVPKVPKAALLAQQNFHELVLLWNAHVYSEVDLHNKFRQGAGHLDSHLKETIRMQRQFLEKIEKLEKKVRQSQ